MGKYVAGTGGVESFAEVPGVVEVPHQCERLFMQQCGKTRAREYSGVDAISDPSVPRLQPWWVYSGRAQHSWKLQ